MGVCCTEGRSVLATRAPTGDHEASRQLPGPWTYETSRERVMTSDIASGWAARCPQNMQHTRKRPVVVDCTIHANAGRALSCCAFNGKMGVANAAPLKAGRLTEWYWSKGPADRTTSPQNNKHKTSGSSWKGAGTQYRSHMYASYMYASMTLLKYCHHHCHHHMLYSS